jgi:MtN3 and saliva related transmembrane protein
MIDLIGWTASAILVVTIITQIRKQWRERTSKGVSKWLFVGQIAASVGFIVYSVLLRNIVFIVTNSAMLLSALVGMLIVLRHRSKT